MSQQPSPSPRQSGQGGAAPRQRGARNALPALRLGITLLASLGGVVVFIALQGLGANATLAAVVGLIFALLSRQAASSLVVDALLRRARQSPPGPLSGESEAGARAEPPAPHQR